MRRKKQQQKEQARQQKLRAKQDEEQAAIEAWFSKYDVSRTGAFSKEEMRTLLTDVKRKVTEDPNAVVSEGASARLPGSTDPQLTSNRRPVCVCVCVWPCRTVIKGDRGICY